MAIFTDVALSMIFKTEIKRWGNSLALRISKPMAELPDFSEGTQVLIETKGGIMTVKPAKNERQVKLPFSEQQLLDDMTPEAAHAEEAIDLIDEEWQD
ncbi:hypothetical protein LG288_03135 [Idiomarina seosinensis]|uniref:AbrB/MazE/SpoVT family DNA-binding domain-containing protein n=1 Tax=Idiomarina seosinensis TaxID=281739 RepID=UPI00384C4CFD